MDYGLLSLIIAGTHIISVLKLLVSLPIYIFNIISGNTDLKNYYRKNTILSFIHCVFSFITVLVVVVSEQI
jgi:CBS domain containing-hemolysin-like protein